jgi:polyribonucleotide nucleotidyltransferase
MQLYNEAVINEITIPTTLKTKTKSPSDLKEYETTSFCPVKQEHFGMIIGKKGNVIKKITDTFRVRISVGKWLEPSKENREDYDDHITGALVTGLAC